MGAQQCTNQCQIKNIFNVVQYHLITHITGMFGTLVFIMYVMGNWFKVVQSLYVLSNYVNKLKKLFIECAGLKKLLQT